MIRNRLRRKCTTGKVQHPDKATGQPGTGSAYEDTYFYNAVGQEKFARYDRNEKKRKGVRLGFIDMNNPLDRFQYAYDKNSNRLYRENVVSAAFSELYHSGEMGPIEHYANARTITGRAGLRPSRYQRDQVDQANGPLRRCANRKLRAAILRIADNLVKCNHHFNVLLQHWKAAGKDPRHTRLKVALRFCRIAYQSVAGRQVFRHPCLQGRHYLLEKLSAFHRDHGTPMDKVLRDLQAAITQVPPTEYAAEAQPLQAQLHKLHEGGKRGPPLLGDILPIVLARLGVVGVPLGTSGEPDLH